MSAVALSVTLSNKLRALEKRLDAVEVKIHENVFTVRRGGVWYVPCGKSSLLSFLRHTFYTHSSSFSHTILFLFKRTFLYDGSHFMLISVVRQRRLAACSPPCHNISASHHCRHCFLPVCRCGNVFTGQPRSRLSHILGHISQCLESLLFSLAL